MAADEGFKQELIRRIPDLERFAKVLTRNAQDSQDLAHDTVMAAIDKADEFTPGTNMVAWLFTIQRGLFNNLRKRDRTRKAYHDSHMGDSVAVLPDQFDYLVFEDAKQIIERLPFDQQAALYLISHDGLSYKEAALRLGCNVGTVKSRVSRARAEIYKGLDMGHERSSEDNSMGM